MMFSPVGVGQEEAVDVLGQSGVDAESTGGAGLEHSVRELVSEAVQDPVERLVMTDQPVAGSVAVVNAVAASAGVDIEVPLEPPRPSGSKYAADRVADKPLGV